MTRLFAPLGAIARNGRLVLMAGLAAGVGIPPLAEALRPYIAAIVALMLFVSALRIGPRQAVGQLSQMRLSFGLALLFQVAFPMVMALALRGFGASGPLANACILMAAASPIAGGPNLVLLTGNDPAPALRLLVVGTALLPLTIVPAFALWPAFGAPWTVALASMKLLGLIGVATGLAFAIRIFVLPQPAPETIAAIDGISAITMAVAVIGLMSAFGPALRTEPGAVVLTLLVAAALNFGAQLATFAGHRAAGETATAAAHAISAGNRNVMLFLTVLPAAITEPLLLFIACYQVPMFLTPLLFSRLYKPGEKGSGPRV